MQKHRSIAQQLQVQVLTYIVFRQYVRPSVQQRSSGLCLTVTRCPVKSSLAILIEREEKREEERQDTHRLQNDRLKTIWYMYVTGTILIDRGDESSKLKKSTIVIIHFIPRFQKQNNNKIIFSRLSAAKIHYSGQKENIM